MFANQSCIFQPATHRFCYLFVQFQVVFRSFLPLYLANLSQDVDDVEMFERRINAMLTIGIKKEDLTQVPPKFWRGGSEVGGIGKISICFFFQFLNFFVGTVRILIVFLRNSVFFLISRSCLSGNQMVP